MEDRHHLTRREVLLLAGGAGGALLASRLNWPDRAEAATYSALGAPPELAHLTYPEPRVYLETQSWWVQGNTGLSAPGANFAHDSTHVHLGRAYPSGEQFILPPAGQGYTWPYLAIFHNDVGGTVRQVRGGGFQIGSDGSILKDPNSVGVKITTNDQKLAGNIVYPADRVNTWRAFTGTAETRFTADTTSRFGQRQFNSTRWFTQLNAPGQPVIIKARGWYQGGDYVDVQLSTKTRASTLANGTAIFPGKTLTYAIGAGAQWAFAYIDPDLHNGSKGTVLFENRTGSSGSFVVPALSPGVHKLMLGSWEKLGNGWSGVACPIPFQVN